jgi:membrane protease YdiL (CAAX protease family)
LAPPLNPLETRGPGSVEAVAVLATLVLIESAADAVLPATLSALGTLRFVETVSLLVYWKSRGWGLADLGLTGRSARRGWATGAAMAAGFGALVGIAEFFGRWFWGWSFLGSIAGSSPFAPKLAVLIAVGALLAPFFEELVFRGVLYGGFRKRLGPLWATVLVTLLFAIAHGLTARVPWVQAVGGVLFCAAYEISRSLWAPVVVHVTGNLAIFLLPFWIR